MTQTKSNSINNVAIVTCLAIGWIVAEHTDAAPFTDSSSVNPSAATIDFESLPLGPVANPLTIGGATFSTAPGMSIVSIAGFAADGNEVADKTLHPLPGGFGSGDYTPLTISFSSPMREVGLGWFDPNLPGSVLRAFDGNHVLLEEAGVTLGPIGGVFAAFIGFRRATPDISRIDVVPANSGEYYSIDNLRFTATVPEPTTSCFLVIGLLGAVAVAANKRPGIQSGN